MTIYARKKILLAKIESVYGTDPTPTGAANAILTHGLQINPLVANTITRDLDRGALGNDVMIHVGSHVEMEFDVEIAGSSAAGTAPSYGPLLRACGFDETIVAVTSVTYAPVSASFESVTCYFHHDGQLHKMTGARGSVSMKLSPGGIPYYHFKMVGLWADPAATADPTPDWSSFIEPVPVDSANTTTFTLHGVSYNMVDLNIDMKNSVVFRDVVGSQSVLITDRSPDGSVVFEAPDLGTKNWFTTAKSNTTGVLALVHGTAAGNIVTINAPLVQLLAPKYGDSDGVSVIEAGLSLVPSDSGDDEISIAIT